MPVFPRRRCSHDDEKGLRGTGPGTGPCRLRRGTEACSPTDSTLSQDMDTGRDAVGLDRLAVAEQQYRAAGERAVARDDVTAIGDAGYNLATVQLDENKPQDALATITSTRAALALRGQTTDDTGLDLVQAGALHRLGREAEAAKQAALLQARRILTLPKKASSSAG